MRHRKELPRTFACLPLSLSLSVYPWLFPSLSMYDVKFAINFLGINSGPEEMGVDSAETGINILNLNSRYSLLYLFFIKNLQIFRMQITLIYIIVNKTFASL